MSTYPNIDANVWIGLFCWGFEAVAVNCYVFISGYFLVIASSGNHLHKLINLWKTVFFYALGISAALLFFHQIPSNWTVWARAILPVKYEAYWFVTAYVGLYAIYPYSPHDERTA